MYFSVVEVVLIAEVGKWRKIKRLTAASRLCLNLSPRPDWPIVVVKQTTKRVAVHLSLSNLNTMNRNTSRRGPCGYMSRFGLVNGIMPAKGGTSISNATDIVSVCFRSAILP